MKPGKKIINPLIFIFILFSLISNAQDPNRFSGQVEELAKKEYNFNPGKKLLLFTGSSSIRMWKDVQDRFPDFNVINNGFGGSHFSDLIYFYDELIKKHSPEIIFIYEGDNDIASKKWVCRVKRDAKKLHKNLQEDFPEKKIVFIAPKPSIARWHLKRKYERFNRKLNRYAGRKNNTEFADVWSAMIDENGQVFQDIFLEDDLHMNKKGYDLWEQVMRQFVEG